LSFWFFAVSDGFFIGDAGFFVGPTDFLWTSTGFSDNVAIFSLLPLLRFASAPAWAAHATSYKITLVVLNVGFSLGFGFLFEIMLQYSSVPLTLKTNNFKGSLKSHALGWRSSFTCYGCSSCCASEAHTFTRDFAVFFFFSSNVAVPDFFFSGDAVVVDSFVCNAPCWSRLE
jgi:hypothetical protein